MKCFERKLKRTCIRDVVLSCEQGGHGISSLEYRRLQADMVILARGVPILSNQTLLQQTTEQVSGLKFAGKGIR